MKNDFTNRPAYKQSAGILTGSASVFFLSGKSNKRQRSLYLNIGRKEIVSVQRKVIKFWMLIIYLFSAVTPN